MAKQIIIAGAVPGLHQKKVVETEKGLVKDSNSSANQNPNARYVKLGDILDEGFFDIGQIGELSKQGFIEEYKPYKLTDADIKANPHLAEHHAKKAGDEVHSGPKHDIYTLKPRAKTISK